jgi:hypothetical protein
MPCCWQLLCLTIQDDNSQTDSGKQRSTGDAISLQDLVMPATTKKESVRGPSNFRNGKPRSPSANLPLCGWQVRAAQQRKITSREDRFALVLWCSGALVLWCSGALALWRAEGWRGRASRGRHMRSSSEGGCRGRQENECQLVLPRPCSGAIPSFATK